MCENLRQTINRTLNCAHAMLAVARLVSSADVAIIFARDGKSCIWVCERIMNWRFLCSDVRFLRNAL